MEKEVVAISASSASTFQACPTAYHYSSELRLTPFNGDEKMDKGSLGHAMLAHYYQLIKDGAADYGSIQDSIEEEGRIEAVKFDLNPDAIEQTITSVRGYIEARYGDSWEPVLIEQPFSKVLYDSETLQIIWEGRLDLGIKNRLLGDKFIPVDHKFGAKAYTPEPMNNQFLGTTWAFGADEFIVNLVGMQKKEQKYSRHPISYPKEVIEEWQQSTISTVIEMLQYEKQGYYPRRYNSCWKCKFTGLCYSHPEAREYKMKVEFTKKQFSLYETSESTESKGKEDG